MIAVVLDGKIINIGPWVYQLDDGTENPLPEGAVEGEYTVIKSAGGTYLLNTDYAELRRAEYPPIQDQLDALYQAGLFPEPMNSMLKAVKDKYPKP